ncbi:MAG: hypothetical protein JO197_07115 [Acidobacteria bacterium]|nr:hypothetical protein [Acidobacteriota bacterium]MBV9475631.1 hypothetical protein [Acidobacteriota bacterium]
MVPHGSDRLRTAGGKLLLLSLLPKGWTARTPKTSTTAEFPGTAVFWDEQYFEVLDAKPQPRGVLYVLAPWSDAHTIRTFAPYDDASEARLATEAEAAARRQKQSFAAQLSGVLLGHLPAAVQDRIGSELGVAPSRMTLLSCVIGPLTLGACFWKWSGAALAQQPSPVPLWAWLVAGALMLDSIIRFLIVFAQDRAAGSLPGIFVYIAIWLVAPKRVGLVSPFASARGTALFTLAPPDDVATRDAIEMRGSIFSLLTPAEQASLAARYGFDYRRYAFGMSWTILAGAAIGVVTSAVKVADSRSVSAFVSLVVAAVLAVEQLVRLPSLQRGPAGSILGALVRPFVRGYLERG